MIHYLSVSNLVQDAVLKNCRISDLVLAPVSYTHLTLPTTAYV